MSTFERVTDNSPFLLDVTMIAGFSLTDRDRQALEDWVTFGKVHETYLRDVLGDQCETVSPPMRVADPDAGGALNELLAHQRRIDAINRSEDDLWTFVS